MPSKKHSTARIDGIVAVIIGLSRALNGGNSIYSQPGMLFL